MQKDPTVSCMTTSGENSDVECLHSRIDGNLLYLPNDLKYIKISDAIRLGRGKALLLLRQNDTQTGGFREPTWARTSQNDTHP